MTDRNNGNNTDARNSDGAFAPGNPGNPMGGRHRETKAVEHLLEAWSEALIQKALDLALEGDANAMKTAASFDRFEKELREMANLK